MSARPPLMMSSDLDVHKIWSSPIQLLVRLRAVLWDVAQRDVGLQRHWERRSDEGAVQKMM